MVALDPPEVKAVPLEQVIGQTRTVPVGGDTIQNREGHRYLFLAINAHHTDLNQRDELTLLLQTYLIKEQAGRLHLYKREP